MAPKQSDGQNACQNVYSQERKESSQIIKSPHLLRSGRCEGYPIPCLHHIVDYYEGLGLSHCAPRTRIRQDLGRGHRVLGLDHLGRSGPAVI